MTQASASGPIQQNIFRLKRKGTRLRIVAEKKYGSAALLNGLTGRSDGPHPIVEDWIKIVLDPTERALQIVGNNREKLIWSISLHQVYEM